MTKKSSRNLEDVQHHLQLVFFLFALGKEKSTWLTSNHDNEHQNEEVVKVSYATWVLISLLTNTPSGVSAIHLSNN